jgi:hypothetical protein
MFIFNKTNYLQNKFSQFNVFQDFVFKNLRGTKDFQQLG